MHHEARELGFPPKVSSSTFERLKVVRGCLFFESNAPAHRRISGLDCVVKVQ